MSTLTQSYRLSARSIRFSFRFESGAFTLFDRRELEMRALPGSGLEPIEPGTRSGCWLEVQDADGGVLYRWVMAHPMIRRSEVFEQADGTDEPRTILWAAERGACSVVVPNLAGGADLALFASPTQDLEILQPAVEVLRVALRGRGTRPGSQPGEDRRH